MQFVKLLLANKLFLIENYLQLCIKIPILEGGMKEAYRLSSTVITENKQTSQFAVTF